MLLARQNAGGRRDSTGRGQPRGAATVTDGIFTVDEATYHADAFGDDGQASLSASIAKILLEKSPLHAFTEHPRLNPNYVAKDEAKYDVGNVCHALLLEGREAVSVVHADSWRTKDAKEMAEHARALGKTPLLAHQWADVQAMCEAVRQQVDALELGLLSAGKPEQTLLWHENGVACRARVDWLADDYTYITDIKTTSRSANPAKFSRTVFDLGYDVQASWYRRGVERLTGVTPEFRLLVCEVAPPYAVSVVGLAPSAVELGNAKVDWALDLWARCVASGEWPGYDQRVAFTEPPAWLEAQWLEREAREVAA
jgi:hypothetical protein